MKPKAENIKAPIGLTSMVKALQRNLTRNPACPPCYLVDLDAGNGHTTLVRYAAELNFLYGTQPFHALDRYLEYELDGSLDQLEQVLYDIRSNAVFTNHYEGVIGMDIGSLSYHINEIQTELFQKELAKINRHATVILFVPSAKSSRMEQLIHLIGEVVDLELVHAAPYSEQDLAKIVSAQVSQAGVIPPDDDQVLLDAIRRNKVHTAADAKKLSRRLICQADGLGKIPTLQLTYSKEITK